MELLAKKIRARCIAISQRTTGCHLGGCLSVADILAVLFTKFGKTKDNLIILSKGHAAAALYAVLFELGLLNEDPALSYGEKNSIFTGHPHHKISHIQFATGALGHGPALGLGWALGQKLQQTLGRVYVIVGDGELQEGSCWEAFQVAVALRLDNFVVIVDRNRAQNDGWVDSICPLGDLEAKAQAFGFLTVEINGHNLQDLQKSVDLFKTNQPVFIIANTVKGKGINELENNVKCHYVIAKPNMVNKWLNEVII